MSPKVSVLIPSYNHSRFIATTIESVLCQTEPDFELLILDDGSTDESASIIERYAAQDPRIRFSRQHNSGTIETLNRLYSQSQGQYICHLGSDDVWRPTFLESSISDLERHPNYVATFCNFSMIDESGNVTIPKGVNIKGDLADGPLMAEICICNIIAALTACIRRTALEQTLPFARQRKGVEDWDLWLRLGLIGPMKIRDENHGFYRMHGNNQSLNNQQQAFASQIEILTDLTEEIIARYNLSQQISINYLIRKIYLYEQTGQYRNSCRILEQKRKLYGLHFAEYAMLASNYLLIGELQKAKHIEYILQQVRERAPWATSVVPTKARGADDAVLT